MPYAKSCAPRLGGGSKFWPGATGFGFEQTVCKRAGLSSQVRPFCQKIQQTSIIRAEQVADAALIGQRPAVAGGRHVGLDDGVPRRNAVSAGRGRSGVRTATGNPGGRGGAHGCTGNG
jgi:hypothetical protein